MTVEAPEVVVIDADRIQIAVFVLQPLQEAVVVKVFLRRPCLFGDGYEPWEDHVAESLPGADSFRPEVGLDSDYMLVIGQLISIYLIHLVAPLFPGQVSFLASDILYVVEVERVPWRDDGPVAVFQSLFQGFRMVGAPPVDDGPVLVHAAADHVVPCYCHLPGSGYDV